MNEKPFYKHALIEAVVDPHSEMPIGGKERQKESELCAELKSIFTAAGWEGDGEINCIFLPPCFLDRDDGWCGVVYHVKQNSNGTCWLAIPRGLNLSLPKG